MAKRQVTVTFILPTGVRIRFLQHPKRRDRENDMIKAAALELEEAYEQGTSEHGAHDLIDAYYDIHEHDEVMSEDYWKNEYTQV